MPRRLRFHQGKLTKLHHLTLLFRQVQLLFKKGLFVLVCASGCQLNNVTIFICFGQNKS